VLFTAGGIATPADAAMMMQLGAEGVFVGSRDLQVRQPGPAGGGDRQGDHVLQRPDVIAKVSRGLGEAMVGINVEELPQSHRLAERGW
jgi:pyridoxal 5'-phosphate synthase pdxS subunit